MEWCSQYPSHYLGTRCIQHYYRWCAHLGRQQSTELTLPANLNGLVLFARKTKSGFCACAITFQTQCNSGTSFSWVKQPEVVAACSPSNPVNSWWMLGPIPIILTRAFMGWTKRYHCYTSCFGKCYDFRKTLDSALPFPVYTEPVATGGNCFHTAVLISWVAYR